MPGKKIIIIDDDPDIVGSMKIVLEQEGFLVDSSDNIDDGLKKIDQAMPDLIILDVVLEKMCDGFDLARKLKDDEKYSKIPILMLTAVKEKTGFTFSSQAGDTMWLPVEEYVEKPISPQALIAKVKKLTGEKD